MSSIRSTAPHLAARGVTLGYDDAPIIDDLTLDLPDGAFTVIVGPNACGKSTALRALSRLMKPRAGAVLLDGRDIATLRSKDVARQLSRLPQSSIAPEGIRVIDLVARGRFPHQSLVRSWSADDERVVADAMAMTGVVDLSHRFVDELSGGQRQRVWMAMLLAQDTSLLLLDEPTTYLDLTHQIELLDLCAELTTQGRTVVAVLHDLNLAFRYADNLVVMRAGKVEASGAPADIVSAELIEQVFALPCRIIDDPESHTPLVVPKLTAGAPALAER